jgi:hypothetical protein
MHIKNSIRCAASKLELLLQTNTALILLTINSNHLDVPIRTNIASGLQPNKSFLFLEYCGNNIHSEKQ